MERTFKFKAGDDLGALASKHFAGVEVPVRLVDVGQNDEETQASLLRSGGSWTNVRAIFVGGGEALARQKDLKDLAKELAPKVEAGEMTKEDAIAAFVERGASETAPVVAIRGEGTTTRKPTAKQVEKAKDQIVANAQAKLDELSPEEKAAAQALLVKLGLAPAPVVEAAPAPKSRKK